MKRATRYIVQMKEVRCISIHALVKRATVLFGILLVLVVISIHALVKRATNHC